jgi:hypothetical protein
MAAPIQPWTGKNLLWQQEEKAIQSASAATLVNGTTVFRIIGGPIRIMELLSYCVVTCDATAATLQWSVDGDVGSAVTISAASAALTSFAAGGLVYNNFTTINTAPILVTNGVALAGMTTSTGGGIYAPAGIITTVIGSGPTTGTFTHYLRYMPLSVASYVVTA